MKLRILPRALECRLTEIIACSVNPMRRRIDVGVETPDHAELLEPPDPAVTGRRRDADELGQRVVGHPRIGVQRGQDATVDGVDVDGSNILRRPGLERRPTSMILLA